MSHGSQSAIDRYISRRRHNAEFVRNARVPGHEVTADQNWGKSFRSRPGSADWKAHCTCGWSSSAYHYGETEALASAVRHITTASRRTTADVD